MRRFVAGPNLFGGVAAILSAPVRASQHTGFASRDEYSKTGLPYHRSRRSGADHQRQSKTQRALDSRCWSHASRPTRRPHGLIRSQSQLPSPPDSRKNTNPLSDSVWPFQCHYVVVSITSMTAGDHFASVGQDLTRVGGGPPTKGGAERRRLVWGAPVSPPICRILWGHRLSSTALERAVSHLSQSVDIRPSLMVKYDVLPRMLVTHCRSEIRVLAESIRVSGV